MDAQARPPPTFVAKDKTVSNTVPQSHSKLRLASALQLSTVVYNIDNRPPQSYLNGTFCSQEEDIGRKLFHMATNTEPNYGVHTHNFLEFDKDHKQRYIGYGKRLERVLGPGQDL